MKKLHRGSLLGRSRRIIFSLALFVLVFAAASIVKIQAAGNVTGWLWGGSEDGNVGGIVGSGVPDGNETGVGWVSMNRTNCDPDSDGITEGGATNNPAYPACPQDISVTTDDNYGVNIPSSDGDLSGYAWNEGLGWISFNETSGFPSVATGDSYNYRAKRVGDEIRGWARIMSIPQAGANAGGWTGWIRLHSDSNDPVDYGVTVSGNSLTGFGWNGEDSGSAGNIANGLGWINFAQSNITLTPYIELTPSSFSLSGLAMTLRATIRDAAPASQVISFAKSSSGSNPNPSKFILSSTTCTIDNSTGWCEVQVSAADRLAAYTATVTASSSGFLPDSSNGIVIQALSCSIACPSEITVISGQSKDYDVTISGAGCSALDDCQKFSGSNDITVTKVDGNTCRATAADGARFGTAVSRSTSGAGHCDTKVNIKGPGWVETNPN